MLGSARGHEQIPALGRHYCLQHDARYADCVFLLAGRVRYLLPHYLFCRMVYVRLDSIFIPKSRRRLVSYYQGPQKSWVKHTFNIA